VLLHEVGDSEGKSPEPWYSDPRYMWFYYDSPEEMRPYDGTPKLAWIM